MVLDRRYTNYKFITEIIMTLVYLQLTNCILSSVCPVYLVNILH